APLPGTPCGPCGPVGPVGPAGPAGPRAPFRSLCAPPVRSARPSEWFLMSAPVSAPFFTCDDDVITYRLPAHAPPTMASAIAIAPSAKIVRFILSYPQPRPYCARRGSGAGLEVDSAPASNPLVRTTNYRSGS